MGQVSTKPATTSGPPVINDYELVVRSSKDLEFLLEAHFFAQGRGLHEKLSSAVGLPVDLTRRMRYLATIRNRLIHERGVDAIPDRAGFILTFEECRIQLVRIAEERSNSAGRKRSDSVERSSGGWCAVM